MMMRMIRLYITTFLEKFKMKYITGEMVNEDIFPLWQEPKTYTREIDINDIFERLG